MAKASGGVYPRRVSYRRGKPGGSLNSVDPARARIIKIYLHFNLSALQSSVRVSQVVPVLRIMKCMTCGATCV